MEGINIKQLEDKVVRVITKIRESRSRPCFQNILTFVNRGGEFNIDMDKLKDVANIMIDKKIIYVRGNEGKESFYIMSDDDISDDDIDETINDKEALETEGEMEQYINDTFHKTLLNLIKQEVRNQLCTNSVLTANTDDNVPKVIDNPSVVNNNNEKIINCLLDEISFLRKEVASKDEIIKLIINERQSSENNKKVNHANATEKKGVQNSKDNQLRKKCSISDTNLKDESITNKNKRSITVIGDSIIKGIEARRMRHDLTPGDKIYIKSFPGATIECMEDYVKPTIKHNPTTFVLHVGTNDLRAEKSPEDIATKIICLAESLKTATNKIIVSSVTARNDNLNEKGKNVNCFLKKLCNEKAILYCDNSNISRNCLNGSGLHLNQKGTITLANNFLRCLNTESINI